jgi:hypothetical protein
MFKSLSEYLKKIESDGLKKISSLRTMKVDYSKHFFSKTFDSINIQLKRIRFHSYIDTINADEKLTKGSALAMVKHLS